jgi:hypothetical protein
MREVVRSDQDSPVAHFIKRGMGNWDDPDAFLRSLTAQMRRRYVLPRTEEEGRMPPEAAFLSVAQRVSRALPEGQKAVLYLDGLDEAFGPTGRFFRVPLQGILPRRLPEGVVMVLTSRPGDHLDGLAHPDVCETRGLDPDGRDNLDDIRAYLRGQDRARGLGLSDDFVERLVASSEGFFAVAVLYLRERPDLHAELRAWREDPSRLPRGLTGWLTEQWQRVTQAAQPHGMEARAVSGALGLLASAREPLSPEHLSAFLTHVLRGEGGLKAVGFLRADDLARHLDGALRLCEEFFDARDPAQGAAVPYRFFHTRFPEFILTKLTSVERQDCHRLLAEGCAGWGGFCDAARDYALRHRLAHLIAARAWEAFARASGEADFVVARGERFGFAGVHADALSAARAPDLPLTWREAFGAWEAFLRPRLEVLERSPQAYPQEVRNAFLPVAPEPLKGLFEAFRGR